MLRTDETLAKNKQTITSTTTTFHKSQIYVYVAFTKYEQEWNIWWYHNIITQYDCQKK